MESEWSEISQVIKEMLSATKNERYLGGNGSHNLARSNSSNVEKYPPQVPNFDSGQHKKDYMTHLKFYLLGYLQCIILKHDTTCKVLDEFIDILSTLQSQIEHCWTGEVQIFELPQPLRILLRGLWKYIENEPFDQCKDKIVMYLDKLNKYSAVILEQMTHPNEVKEIRNDDIIRSIEIGNKNNDCDSKTGNQYFVRAKSSFGVENGKNTLINDIIDGILGITESD